MLLLEQHKGLQCFGNLFVRDPPRVTSKNRQLIKELSTLLGRCLGKLCLSVPSRILFPLNFGYLVPSGLMAGKHVVYKNSATDCYKCLRKIFPKL